MTTRDWVSEADHGGQGAGAADAGQEGLYVYCLVPEGGPLRPGWRGLDGSEVYVVGDGGLGAAVHGCPARPYAAPGEGLVSEWVLAHHRVVEEAWLRWGTVLPMTFNTIVAGAGGSGAAAGLLGWLEAHGPAMAVRLEALRGRAEYSVLVAWEPAALGKELLQESPELRRLEADARLASGGAGYLYQRRLERRLRSALEERALAEAKTVCDRLGRLVERVHVDRARSPQGGGQGLVSLSCLAREEQVRDLAGEVEALGHRAGFSAWLAGPLPPYSFC